MRRPCFLLILLSVAGFISACQPGGKGVTPNANARLLVGKWNLQQQLTVRYFDGAKKTDTSFSVSVIISAGHLQFNTDGSYNSSGYSAGGVDATLNLNATVSPVGRDSTYGTYTLTGSELKLTSNIAGIGNASFSFLSATTVPVFTPVSNFAQITELTSSSLSIHTEYITTVTQDGSTHTLKDDEDYIYNK